MRNRAGINPDIYIAQLHTLQ